MLAQKARFMSLAPAKERVNGCTLAYFT